MFNDYHDTSGYNRLFLAVHNGEINLLPSLFKEYSCTDAINGKTLINVAAARGHVEIVRMLRKINTNINALLNIAIEENQPSVFNLVIKECDVNAIDCDGKTALHYATDCNRVDFAKILIENGARVNIRSIDERTPIYHALLNQNVQLLDILFQNGAVLIPDDKDPTLLEFVVESKNLKMIKLLAKNGWYDIDILLKAAVKFDHSDVVKYLMKSVSKRSGIITQDDLNLYSICIKRNSINTLKYLIDSGIKSRRIMLNDKILLRWNKVYKYLLTCRSKIITDFSETQLHSAVRAGELKTVKTIVKQQKNIVETDFLTRKLAVYIAVENGNEDILQVLLKAGYSVKSCFDDISPLHLAATYEDTRLLELLLKAGADVNSETEDCLTPLHFAALAGRSNVVKFLLNNGANPSNRNHNSSLSYALKSFRSVSSITSSVFTNLVEITKILILQNTNENFYELLVNATGIKVYNNESKQNTEQNSEFRPDLVRCIFNHLTDTNIKYFSELLLKETRNEFDIPLELLHLLIEYNDSRSCDSVLFNGEYISFLQDDMLQLLIIDYSRNIENLVMFLALYDPDNELEDVESTDIFKSLIARLVLITDSVDARVLKFCRRKKLSHWQKKCETQKRSMKNTPVADDSKVTFYDIVTEPVDRIANYVRNKNFRKIIKSSYGKFPAFSDFLKIRIERGIRRKNLREECTNVMYNLIKRNHKIVLSDSDLDLIFQYLSVVDLRRFSAAFS